MTTRALPTLSALAVLAIVTSTPAAMQAQQSRRAPAKLPEVAVGGIQVVKVAVSDDDWSAKPFSSSNGTKLVLWIKMPPGMGVIEIDDDASVLESFTDDKGTDLGGELDSFPDEFKDGSGATMDISSNALPAAGATLLMAEGRLKMSVATGTKPVKVSNVRLENDRTFKLGATVITVSEVGGEDEEQTFTLKLPRQVMAGIKEVKFLDAKGEEVEGRRTSSSYFNDDAEMGFSVKTTAKSLTMQFEQWQGLRDLEVPFKVKAGVALVQ